MEQFLQVGVISSTHGLRGEVKVFPTTDDAARFQTLKNVVLDTGKEKLDLEIQSVRFFKQFVIVKFKGIDNIVEIQRKFNRSRHALNGFPPQIFGEKEAIIVSIWIVQKHSINFSLVCHDALLLKVGGYLLTLF